MIEVEAPDGTVVEFPDETPPEIIQQTMRQNFQPEPGFLERAGGAISEFAQGTAKAIVGESDFDLPELTEGLNDLLLDPNLSKSDKDRVGRLTTKLPLARQDQDLEGFVKSEFPNARVFSDTKGNRFARILDRDLALNKAGLSAQDINQVMSEGLIFGAGAVLSVGPLVSQPVSGLGLLRRTSLPSEQGREESPGSISVRQYSLAYWEDRLRQAR